MGAEDSVGRLLAFLEGRKIADDTIIVYAGDNGIFHGEHGLHGKLEAYEESIRVPMMARDPRLIKARQRCDSFVINVDLAPTILDLCGVRPAAPMQGRSWKPLATGNAKSVRWRGVFFYEMFGAGGRGQVTSPTVKALRSDRYKLILNLNPTGMTELYDLKNDPQEMKNLAADKNYCDLIHKLKQQMLGVMRELEGPAMPVVEAARV